MQSRKEILHVDDVVPGPQRASPAPLHLSAAQNGQRTALIDQYLRTCITHEFTQAGDIEQLAHIRHRLSSASQATAQDPRTISTMMHRIKRTSENVRQLDYARVKLLVKLVDYLQHHTDTKSTLRAALFLLLNPERPRGAQGPALQEPSGRTSPQTAHYTHNLAILRLLAEDIIKFGTVNSQRMHTMASHCESRYPATPVQAVALGDVWRHELDAYVSRCTVDMEDVLVRQQLRQHKEQLEKWTELLHRTKQAFESFAPVSLVRVHTSQNSKHTLSCK